MVRLSHAMIVIKSLWPAQYKAQDEGLAHQKQEKGRGSVG